MSLFNPKTEETNLIRHLVKTQFFQKNNKSPVVPTSLFESIEQVKEIQINNYPISTVCFDRTGHLIFTGADDGLIRLFYVFKCLLKLTFRGHEKAISCINVNFENTLLASGSCEQFMSIRIWEINTGKCLHVLQGHFRTITQIEFSPICFGIRRWLVSAGNDGALCFWNWNTEDIIFSKPTKFIIDGFNPVPQISCISFSTDGSFLVAGSNNKAVYIYFLEKQSPISFKRIIAHESIVNNIQFANNSLKFTTASNDGTARVWFFESGIKEWNSFKINAGFELNQPNRKKNKVIASIWNADDSLIVTSLNEFKLKVWSSFNGQIKHELEGHNDEISCMLTHKQDKRILVSADESGCIILWDILKGSLLKMLNDKNDGILDIKWSLNANIFASVSSQGFLKTFTFFKHNKIL